MPDPALTPEQYVEQAGEPCPNCGDTRFVEYITGWRREYGGRGKTQPKWHGFFDSESHQGDMLKRRAMCSECKAQWKDEFMLTGYSDLKVEESDA